MSYQQLRLAVIEDLQEYMQHVLDDGGDPGYTLSDINHCAEILDCFYDQIQTQPHGNKDQVMRVITQAVQQLNILSQRCEGMIETDQRELLCDLINTVAYEKGVGLPDEDLTEETREW